MAGAVGVYISVPFCKAKCTFCNFASGVFGAERMKQYVHGLCEEIQASRAAAQNIAAFLPQAVDTMYFGGGTPSLLSGQQFRQIFQHLRGDWLTISRHGAASTPSLTCPKHLYYACSPIWLAYRQKAETTYLPMVRWFSTDSDRTTVTSRTRWPGPPRCRHGLARTVIPMP